MLRGRGRELDLVGRLLRDVRGRGQRAFVIDGEAGVGKTRLVAEAAAVAAGAGFRTFVGAAEPAERGRPFAAVTRLLGPAGDTGDPLAGEICQLVASLENPGADRCRVHLDPGAVGFRVTDAILELLAREVNATPVLLALDDLQWADRPSTELLDAIHRRLAGLPILLLVTVRTGENPMHVNELLGRLALGSRVLTLAPLADDAVAAMAADLTGARVGTQLRAQLAKAQGNPFFVTELLRALGDEGLLVVEGGVVESRATSVLPGLLHTVLRRLRLLPPETLELLRLASILGQSFSVADLARMTRRGTVDLVRQLAPALRTHTLRDSGEQLAFGHALTWEAIYHELPGAVRRAVHRDTATVLAEAGVPAMRVVRHFMLGAELGDTEAVAWLRKAARGVAPGSPATAAELLGTALELAGPDHRDAIVTELAPLLVVIGEVAQANELTEGALARGVDPGVEARLRAGLTHVLMRRGRVGDAKVQAIKLLELIPPDARDLMCGIAGFVLVTSGDADRAEEMAQRALAAGEAIGHDLVVATALMTLTWTYGAHGRVQDAVSAGYRAVAATEHSTATMSGLLFPHCPLGAALLQADRFTEAERAFRDGLARADRTSAPGTLVYHQSGLAATKFLCGDWDAAVSDAEVALDLAGKTGTSWMLLPSAVIARIAVARGDLGTAEAVVDKAFQAPEADHTTMTLDWLYWAHAVLLHAAGGSDRAAAAAERAWRAVPAMRDVIGNRIAPVDCVRIALAAGNRALAEEITGVLGRMAERTTVPSLRAAALHCHGLVAGDPGILTDALALLQNTARRYHWAVVNEDVAVRLAPADRGAARTCFRAALNGYRELAATRDAARVSAAMRAIGLRPGGAARASGNALTHTERTVAALVAEGLSNPQIARRLYISRHTAETHMKHIFTKLGLSSRTELAAMVARGLLPG